jgi:hypothetical protein
MELLGKIICSLFIAIVIVGTLLVLGGAALTAAICGLVAFIVAMVYISFRQGR